MKRRCFLVIAPVLLLVVGVGCTGSGGQLSSTKPDEVERVPTTIAIYPLLSAPVGQRGPIVFSEGISRDKMVYIEPPTDVKLAVTPLSQILAGFISNKLTYYGFDLRELPVETPPGSDSSNGNDRVFVVSLDLLERLHAEYGLEAIAIGTVIFTKTRNEQERVTVAYLKLVDVESLKVLCQVGFNSGDDYGEDMDRVADLMAGELAVMAGLATAVR